MFKASLPRHQFLLTPIPWIADEGMKRGDWNPGRFSFSLPRSSTRAASILKHKRKKRVFPEAQLAENIESSLHNISEVDLPLRQGLHPLFNTRSLSTSGPIGGRRRRIPPETGSARTGGTQ